LETIVKYFPTNFTVELIVVNNNSNDSTAQTLTDFANKHSWCSVVNEPKQGLSQGEKCRISILILFLDFIPGR
jgi:glycosyltransferase involved in cell wall biosynthesis